MIVKSQSASSYILFFISYAGLIYLLSSPLYIIVHLPDP